MPASLSSFDKFVIKKLNDLFKIAYKVSRGARSKAQPCKYLVYSVIFLLHYNKADLDWDACVAGYSDALLVNYSVLL